ncbi:DNA polymerase V, partial [Acinetobacter baumannii]|nr:DNA polymerase V [Acinetobacter baumannii]
MNAKTKGGYREGAGRKTIYDEPTKTIRVPVSRIVEIKNFLAGNKKPTFNDVASITLINPTTFKR